MKVSGSILSSTLSAKEAINIYNKTSIDYIHLDIMDGKFVNNKTWTIGEINKLANNTTKSFDIHLMVKSPDKYIDDLSLLNTSYITFHYEAVNNHLDIINHIKMNGIKAGIAISPKTSPKEILSLLPYLDLVLIMSVEPGASGQKFMESVLYKIDILKKEIAEKGYKTIINVDGGINDETIESLKEKNVDMVVSASYLLSGDTENKIRNFKN